MKTPEELATDWYIRLLTEDPAVAIKEAYQVGYQACEQQQRIKTAEMYSHGSEVQQIAAQYVKRRGTTGPMALYEENRFIDGYQAAKPQWISVKERLPEDGVPVLVFDTLANTIELMSWDKTMEAFGTEAAYFVRLNETSHWMPLPSVEGLKHED